MTSIAKAAITSDTGPPASVSKAVTQPHDAGAPSSFATMLASASGTEQVRRLAPSLEERTDLPAPDAAAEQREVSLPTQTAAVAPQLTNMMQSAVEAAYLASVSAGRAGGTNEPAYGDRSGVSVARSIGIPRIESAQFLLPQSHLSEAHAEMGMGTVVARHAVASDSSSAPLVRHETHLIAAKASTAAIQQLVLSHANADGDPSSPGSGGRSHAEAVAGLPKSGPGSDEGEGVTVQIAGQVAGALASLRGALPADTASGAPPVFTVGSPSEPASDVVKTIRFNLNPGELGEVHVRLSMSRNEVRLHLSFSSDKAAGIAQAEGQALEQALADAGASVGQIVIDAASLPRVDALLRPGGPPAQTDGPMNGGNGADRERHSQQEAARRHRLREHSPEETAAPGNERAGLFI